MNNVYAKPHQWRCKICNSNMTALIDYQHYYLGVSYDYIIDFHRELRLNGSNLTNHFNAVSEAPEFFAKLKARKLSDDEILEELRARYD